METGEKKLFFRTVSVFDVGMTDPLPGKEPIPLTPPAQPITGDSHADLIAPLRELAGELRYKVEIRALPENGPGGWCDAKHKHIVIADGPANGIVRTLVHEIAHALGIGYEQYGRDRAEVLVDSTVFRPDRSIRGLIARRSVGDACHQRGKGAMPSRRGLFGRELCVIVGRWAAARRRARWR